MNNVRIILQQQTDLKRDYVENFVPFLAELIYKKEYKEIIVSEICKDFTAEYGLMIPYLPMVTILNRIKKRGFIRQSFGKFIPVREKLNTVSFSRRASQETRKIEKVLSELIKFSTEEYKTPLKAYSTFGSCFN